MGDIKENATAEQWITEEETMGWDGRFVAKSDIKKEVCNLWDKQKAYGADDYVNYQPLISLAGNKWLASIVIGY